MTTKFQQYGVHAEVHDGTELFLNAAAVTLSLPAALELIGWAAAELAAGAVVPTTGIPPTAQDQADNDQVNDQDYQSGAALPLETVVEVEVTSVADTAEEPQESKKDAPPPVVKRRPGRPRKNPPVV